MIKLIYKKLIRYNISRTNFEKEYSKLTPSFFISTIFALELTVVN